MDWLVTFIFNLRLFNQDLSEQELARKFAYTLKCIHQSVEKYVRITTYLLHTLYIIRLHVVIWIF